MRVSVIVPVYNTGRYLEKCITSLCRQTHKDMQIILINDGSTDDSLNIMQKLSAEDERICIIDRGHEGVSAARNAGLEIIEGDFISFIDSDDWIDEKTYQICLEQAELHNADAVYFEWTEEFSDGTSEIKRFDGSVTSVLRGEDILRLYYKGKVNIRISSSLLSRRIVDSVRFDIFRERGEDMLFGFYTLCKAECIVYMNQPLYHRYHRLGSLSNRKGFYAEDIGRATCTDVMLDYIKVNKPQFLQDAYVRCFNFYMVILNRVVYFRAEKEYIDIYCNLEKRLEDLLREMESPKKILPRELFWSYELFRRNKFLYYIIVRVYYKYIKKELDSKRQR